MGDIPIKSVRRVFEVLELFDRERRPLSAKEIARRLGYPLMSSHALMKSMRELGYAEFDPPSWCYTPARTLPALLEWVRDDLAREREILDLVYHLNQQTRETVNLSRRGQSQITIIHGMETRYAYGVSVKVGTRMPVTRTLTGIISLAAMTDAELSEFLRHLRIEDPDQAKEVDLGLLENVMAELNEQGTVAMCDLFIKGIGAVCIPVFTQARDDVLVVGVVGPSERIKENEKNYRGSIKKLARECGVQTLRKSRKARIPEWPASQA